MATSPLARAFVNSSVNTTVERFKAAIEAEHEAESTATAAAAEMDALALEAAAASGRATSAISPGGFYTAAAEQAAAEKAAAEKAVAEQAGEEVGAAAAAATATAMPEQAAVEKAGAGMGATAEAGLRESKAQTTAAAAAAASGAAAVIRTYYGASETPSAQLTRRGTRARGPAASILARALRPRRRAAEVEIAAEMVEIAAEDAAEIAEVVEMDAKSASETAAEIEAEARPPTRARPQERYTSEVGAEIEVACSPAEACEAYADLKSFPQYAPLLKCVRVLGGGRSEWELQLPGIVTGFVRVVGMGSLVKWQAAYSVDPPHRLTWRSLSGFENAGSATFVPLGGDRAGCRVVVRMTYSVPTVLKPLENSSWVKRLMSTTMRGAMEAFRQRLETKGRV